MRLKELRIEKNMSQSDLSEALTAFGVKASSRTVQNWEASPKNIPYKKAQDIAQFFGVGVEDLLEINLGKPVGERPPVIETSKDSDIEERIHLSVEEGSINKELAYDIVEYIKDLSYQRDKAEGETKRIRDIIQDPKSWGLESSSLEPGQNTFSKITHYLKRKFDW